ncbi:MAG TPA: hypothetical protein DCR40_06055 [Prolixibacteraceae bacterium]|nr:hypothetical protein [Prolixibacteraceae bacterium]
MTTAELNGLKLKLISPGSHRDEEQLFAGRLSGSSFPVCSCRMIFGIKKYDAKLGNCTNIW